MLESVTILNKGGLILYQYRANPSVLGAGEGAANSAAFTEARINAWMKKALLGRKQDQQSVSSSTDTQQQQQHRHDAMEAVQQAAQSVAVLTESVQHKDKIAVALYPDIFFDGPRAYLKGWIHTLLQRSLDEYELYETAMTTTTTPEKNNNNHKEARPDPKAFDNVFLALLEQSKREKKKSDLSLSSNKVNNGSSALDTGTAGADTDSNNANNKPKKGKEKRHWHDGKAKVTKDAMAALDFSKEDSNTNNSDNNNLSMDPSEQAIAEARAAYLPNYGGSGGIDEDDDDDMDMNPDLAQDENSWGTSFQSVFQQMTGNKVLTAHDLTIPMEEMQKRLTSKNVAQEVAQEICQDVQQQLVGKRLNSFFRVKTAVRQALEASVTKILNRGRSGKDSNLDIIRAAMTKKNSGGSFFLGGGKQQNRKPYVVVNVGINGVGKSTSLAKLAYYFQSHKLKPMLVAGDTFRSGAVEQLNVHAKCLDVPMFQQGYAKDPSAVAKAAIAHVLGMEHVNERPDVVLVDTAGRMQNNAPLMAALGKLVKENQPDLILLVAEALVGNDGVDQLKMFNRAMQSANRQVDAVILTKFDTVSDKVGAALTMTHITGAPILFVGTGQKYHHLKPLHPSAVIRSLFA